MRKGKGRGMDRRMFLKGSTAMAAPFVLGCQVTPVQTAPALIAPPHKPLPPDALKVGLVGCGGRGTGAAQNALEAEDGTVVLTAVGDVFADKIDGCLKALSEALGERQDRVRVEPDRRFTGFDAYKQVIDSGVDVVLLCTSPHFRPQHLRYAIEKGKHVFCEKPVAVDAPGVRSVLETVEMARGKKLALKSGFCWRSYAPHLETYRRLHDGAIGAIRAFYSTYNTSPVGTHPRKKGWSDLEFQIRDWQHFVWLSGDHVVEQAIHSLDKQAWLFHDEPPKSVVAVGGRAVPSAEERGNVWDHFGATFDYGDGVKAFHMCRQWDGCAGENHDYYYGEKGTAVIRGWDPWHAIEAGGETWTYPGPWNDMYQAEHDALFAAIRSGTELNEGVSMTRSTLLAIMTRMAAYTGRVITWEEALNSKERLGPEEYELGPPLAVAPIAIPGKTPFA